MGTYSRSLSEWPDYRYEAVFPVMPPGEHTLLVQVEDAAGARGEDSVTVLFGWETAGPTDRGLTVSFGTLAGDALVLQAGERLEMVATAKAIGFSHYTVESYSAEKEGGITSLLKELLAGRVTAVWDFGDGTKTTDPISMDAKGAFETTLAQPHAYNKPGTYEVILTVTDSHWDRVGIAKRVVSVLEPAAASTPTPAAPLRPRWVLVETRINPNGLPLETMSSNQNPFTGSRTDIHYTIILSEEGISCTDRWVTVSSAGETLDEKWKVIAFTFDPLPSQYVSGSGSVPLRVTGSYSSGNWDDTGSGTFEFRWQNSLLLELRVSQQEPEASTILNFRLPPGDEAKFVATVSGCKQYAIEWIYQRQS
ncbi:MAG: PKD domain-containing protein [Chloroflexi bacterium]|nr:PKD domain-containing protein [Chloroflexota bacterium]